MSAMRQRKLFLLCPFSHLLWNPVRKVWIFNWKKIIYIPENEIKFFSFCIYIAFDKSLYKQSLIVMQCIGNHRQGDEHNLVQRDADDLLKTMPFKLNTYVIDKEFKHTDYLIFCVSLVACRYVPLARERYFVP